MSRTALKSIATADRFEPGRRLDIIGGFISALALTLITLYAFF